ncbi:MAG: translocation/assembly module TamB domain-containing protein [Balneolales bacterium]|nr:translocation/assembly module TamB domain-containing protein [Balneolales bacterium]
MSKGFPNIVRYSIISVAVIGLLFVGIRFSFKSQFVLEKARVLAEQQVSKATGFEVQIGEIEGDLWKKIQVKGVTMLSEREWLSLEEISLSYTAVSFLWGTPLIHSLEMTEFSVHISDELISSIERENNNRGSSAEKENARLVVENISLQQGEIAFLLPEFLPDSTLLISGVDLQASLELLEENAFTLESLTFEILEGRLPEPIKVNTSGGVLGEEITLNELILETGKSLITAQGFSNMSDTTLLAGLETAPFSILELEPFTGFELPEEDLEMSIAVIGNSDSLTFELSMDHPLAPEFFVTTGIELGSGPKVTHFGVTGAGLDVASLTNDSIPVKTADFRISLQGELTKEIEHADIIWGYTFTELELQDYYIDRFIGSGTLISDSLIGHIGVNPHFENQLNAYPKIHGLSTNLPIWSLNLGIKNLNLKDWVKEVQPDTDLHFSVLFEGAGFSLSDQDWNYSLTGYDLAEFIGIDTAGNGSIIPRMDYTSNEIASQKIDSYELKGSINQQRIEAEGYVQIDESKIEFNGVATEFLTENILFNYSIFTDGFDVSEINAFSDFPTSLSLSIAGTGSGINPEECTVTGSVFLENSIVNNSFIQLFTTELRLEQGIVQISDGLLISDVADGAVKGRRNITDINDPDNRLTLDLILKDIQPLAALTNFEQINGVGEFSTEITQDSLGLLNGDIQLNLSDVQLDSVFFASRIQGNTNIDFKATKLFQTDLNIEKPIINKITLEDVNLVTEGLATQDSMSASFELDIVGSDRGRLEQKGFFSTDFLNENVEIEFNEFNFISEISELKLQQPFHVTLFKDGFGTDSLILKSESGAFANVGVPYFYQQEQSAFFRGENFNFGLIQDIVFGERIVDGLLSGAFEYNRVDSEVSGEGLVSLKHLNYKETILDSAQISYHIYEERLDLNGIIFWDGEPKVVGLANVPFVFDEEALDDEFFARPVTGSLTVRPSSIDRFQGILNDVGITETNGVLSFNGAMSGTAGQPLFQGNIELEDPILSGIEADTVFASFEYNNSAEKLDISSEIYAGNERVAQVDIDFPVGYDFRNFVLDLPDKSDSLSIEVFSDDLNLSIFNDFLDENYVANLQGNLDAELLVAGPIELLNPTGYLSLSNSSISVPYTGIQLNDILADISFTENQLVLHDISATSGDGSLSLNGLMDLEGIIPTRVNLKASANRFELSDTRDIKMVVDVDGRVIGDATRPTAIGEIQIVNGYYYLTDFGDGLIEEVELEKTQIKSFAPFDSLAIEMLLEVEDNFFIRSRDYLDLEIEVAGDLDVQKQTGGELYLFGDMRSKEGYIRPLGKRFDIETGELVFLGPADNPELTIRSRFVPDVRQKGESVILYYIVEGPLKELDENSYRFESDPNMEQSDIICYTMFNNPCNLLESWQSVIAEGNMDQAAVNALAQVLIDEVETLATQQLGVDVVQIDNSGTTGATSIRTGWYLNEKTFFTIINEITSSNPKTLFMLEYIINENLDLIVTQGDDKRQGIELRLQFDY